ncbi:FHA domain-containing protein [Bifidobacterium minimum]|uniref:FHA domain-containing protein n=1 Tax=Bifidobacterium minimum TaxID=1693 RepID=A0A087BME6_9BIFI|nr:FHA domain-containing protein [Bifidobacterium minimum]KFI72196.1 FHA domain-containing protein [Bifidobacterium minimum]
MAQRRITRQWVVTAKGVECARVDQGHSVEIGRRPIRPIADSSMTRVEIVDPARSMSKRHAIFRVDESGVATVRDLNSTNGSYVVRADGGLMRLQPGMDFLLPTSSMRLQFGDVALDFQRIDVEIGQRETSDADDVKDLFRYARPDASPQGHDLGGLSVGDILDVRAGEPTIVFHARHSAAAEGVAAAGAAAADKPERTALEEPDARIPSEAQRSHDVAYCSFNANAPVQDDPVVQPAPVVQSAPVVQPTPGTPDSRDDRKDPGIGRSPRESLDGGGSRSDGTRADAPYRDGNLEFPVAPDQVAPDQVASDQTASESDAAGSSSGSSGPDGVPAFLVDASDERERGAAAESDDVAGSGYADARHSDDMRVTPATQTIRPRDLFADAARSSSVSTTADKPDERLVSSVTSSSVTSASEEASPDAASASPDRESASMPVTSMPVTSMPVASEASDPAPSDAAAASGTLSGVAFEPGSVFQRVSSGSLNASRPRIEVAGFTSDQARTTADYTEQFEMARHSELLGFLAMNPSLYDDLYAWLASQGDKDIDAALARNDGYRDYLTTIGK